MPDLFVTESVIPGPVSVRIPFDVERNVRIVDSRIDKLARVQRTIADFTTKGDGPLTFSGLLERATADEIQELSDLLVSRRAAEAVRSFDAKSKGSA